MKARSLSAPGLFLGAAVLIAFTGVVAASAGGSSVDEAGSTPAEPEAVSSSTPDASDTLTTADIEGLIFMREEEKPARDVYLTLGGIWNAPIFSNIAASEQRHMDAILGLLDNYGLDDTMYAETIGRFENHDLQEMYDDLVSVGSDSIEAALEVGAIIEEVDIVDLDEYLGRTTAEDMPRTYEDLLRGSRNHLRAFVSQLEAAGVDRPPYLLATEDYESILASETGRGGGNRGAGGAASDVQRGSGQQERNPQGGGRGLGGPGWSGGGF